MASSTWWAAILDVHATAVLSLLAAAWGWSAVNRGRELRRLRAGEGCTCGPRGIGDDDDSAPTSDRPALCVLVPCKGVRSHSMRNWRSFLDAAASYGGPCEVRFCVESEDDDAVEAIEILRDYADKGVRVRVVVAGRAKTCSQKLHNVLAGLDASETAGPRWHYTLCLDDDVLVVSPSPSSNSSRIDPNSPALSFPSPHPSVPPSPRLPPPLLGVRVSSAARAPVRLPGRDAGARRRRIHGDRLPLRRPRFDGRAVPIRLHHPPIPRRSSRLRQRRALLPP